MTDKAQVQVWRVDLHDMCTKRPPGDVDIVLFPSMPMDFGNMGWLQGQLRSLWHNDRVFVLPRLPADVLTILHADE